jgi:hypothetical protein
MTLPEPAETANVSGTFWIHDSGGRQPLVGASLGVWVETARWGGGLGRPVVTDAEGRYTFRAPLASSVRIIVAASPPYQPCAATLTVNGDVTRDVHTVRDREQLGARLPPQFLSQIPTLSGVVFEVTPEGRRFVSEAHLELVTADGGEIALADTLTDRDGRYVLCGLERDPSFFLYVSKPGYTLFGKGVVLTGNATTFDVELQRR